MPRELRNPWLPGMFPLPKYVYELVARLGELRLFAFCQMMVIVPEATLNEVGGHIRSLLALRCAQYSASWVRATSASSVRYAL